MSTRLLLLLAIMGAFFDLNALAQRPLLLERQDTGFDENPAPGVTVTTLSSHILNEADRGGLRFDRVPLSPGTSTADVLAGEENLSSGGPPLAPFGGPQLLYVEAGVAVVDGDEDEIVYPAGEQFVMPAGAQYNIRNDTGRCASVLRLVVEPLYGGGFGSLVGGPELAVRECGAPRDFLTTTSAALAINVPSQAFIARVTFEPGDFDPGGTPGLGSHTHPGRTALVVEEGTMMMQEGSGGVDGITYFLEPGSVVEIGPGEPHAEYYLASEGTEAAVVTIAGVVPVGQELITPHDQVTGPGLSSESTYTSPLFDFTIA